MKKQKPNPPSAPQKISKPADSWFQKNKLLLILLGAILLVFANTIPNRYGLDDEFYTNHGNKLTDQGIKAIPQIFKTRTFNNADGSGYSYRPVAVASFAVEHQFFTANPHISHAINLLLYLFTAVVLFKLLRKWLSAYSEWLAFFICLLFFLHPLHTEVVANIKCRDEIIAMLGGLLCLWFAWLHYETGKWQYALLYPLFFVLGLLSKHTIAPLVFLLPMVFYFFTHLEWKKIFAYTIPLLASPVAIVLLQRAFLSKQSRALIMQENPIAAMKLDFVERSATSAYVLGKYLWLHFIPHPLVYYYGYSYVPIADWLSVIPILSVIVYAALFGFALYQLKSKSLLSFGILFYLIGIAPYSNLWQPAPGIMAERFTYLATFGFSVAVCVLVFRCFKLDGKKFEWSGDYKKAAWVLFTIAALFSVRSIVRNADWKDKVTLYTRDMKHLGTSAKANMMYGNIVLAKAQQQRIAITRMMNAGQQYRDSVKILYAAWKDGLNVAQQHFKTATEITPMYSIAWINLASTYFFQDNFEKALIYSKKGFELNPKSVEGSYNTGMAYNSLKQPDSAAVYMQITIGIDSSHIQSYQRLSEMKWAKGDTVSALQVLKTCVEKNPGKDDALVALSQLFLRLGDTSTAVTLSERAAEVNPKNLERLRNLSNWFQSRGNNEKANYYLQKLNEQKGHP